MSKHDDLRRRLEELFSYDETNGTFIRRKHAPKNTAGSIAGSGCRYCWRIQFDCKSYARARLVWLWHTGELPSRQLLKLNGSRYDDRFVNLRMGGVADGHKQETLTADRLRQVLKYDPTTGKFKRRIAVPGHKVGEIAGTLQSNGYITIFVDHRQYSAHRLAWLYMTGAWPTDDIDHANLCKSDNSWSNLRPADKSQNSSNYRSRGNQSGFKGVRRSSKNRWRAEIMVRGTTHYLGYFSSAEEAFEARCRAAEKLHGEFARHD